MAKEATKVFFVTWPDGKIVEGSQTSVSVDIALGRTLAKWLIPEFFPGLDFGGRWGGGVLWHAWPAMERAGFKVHEIAVPADGVSS